MEFTFYTFVKILGSLAVFIYGMKLMSEGIQRAAGNSLRSILRSFTKSKIRGLITGFFTTAIIQSSSATTVMTVSLVNAGLITLVESVGLMMGANIGTTITAWIIATLGFRFDIYSLILPLFLVGLPLILNTKGKLKYWGEFVIGFAILFMGLNYLQQSIPDINTDSEFVNWIRDSTGSGVMIRFLFVAIGALMTIIIQSSSAAIVLTMTMCVKGWISFELGACLVMGENIGTTITAEVASLIGNKNARRSARIHTLFNIIGVLWMVLLLPFFLQGISWITQTLFHQENPMLVPSSRDYGLASFHTLFNLTNVVLLLPFSYYLIKVAKMTVLAGEDQEVSRLKFFGVRRGTCFQ